VATSLIIFEDEHLLVVNKPAGWNTHAPSSFAGEGIYDWLKHREPRWARLAIIHRLDKETSGFLVFGKSPEANRSLTQQFTERAVKKWYVLLTDRSLPREKFVATSNLSRSGERYTSSAAGERAETHFEVIRNENGQTVARAEPITGRTHQIRVHASENHFPILGDTLYGGTPAPRVFLHAEQLSFRHPISNELLTFNASADWAKATDSLRAAVVDIEETNAFRLIHGVSDGSPGVYVDRLGDWLLAQSDAELSPSQHDLLTGLAGRHRSRGIYHKVLNRNVRRANIAETSPRLVLGDAAPERFTIRENGLSFEMSFSEGYSVGLFLDQRDNRRRFLTNYIAADFFMTGAKTQIREAASLSASAPLRDISVLNTFAYTCGFSVAAAKAGARTTSLDLSKKYLDWGKRNFVLNGLDPAQHDFIFGDAFDWMRRLAKKGRTFDCIVLDPPTFSQSKESGTWQAEKDFGKLVTAALPLLKRGAVLLASTNSARLAPENFVEAVRASVLRAGRKLLKQHYVPQPPDFVISREEPAYLKTLWLRVE
jgi:23S rRNA (cytosine1962-C5)-methyltransferase